MRTFWIPALAFCLLCAHAAEKKQVRLPTTASGGPFSPGILAGGTLFVSGMVGRDASGKYPDQFEDEVKLALESSGAVLKAAGYDFEDAVAVQVYLTDMTLFDRMNKVYVTFFPEPRPARTTVGVAKLVGAARLEITVTAWKDKAAAKAAKVERKKNK